MSNNQTIKGKNLNAELVTVSDKPSTLDNGAKYVYVGYNNKNLVVQTPEMEIPFGLNVYSEGKYPKYSVDISFKGMDDNKSMKMLHENLNKMDNKLIAEGMKQSKNWFKKANLSKEVVEGYFTRTIKVPEDKEGNALPYPHRLKLKIPFKDDQCLTEFFDKSGNKLTDDISKILVRNCTAKVIMQCVGLWISAKNYMCQWKAVRMEVVVPQTEDDTNFLPDTDDEDEGEAPAPSKVESKDEEEKEENENEEEDDEEDEEDDSEDDSDDDEEDDSDEESEEEPEPEPEPVKKKSSKSKSKGKSKK